MTRLNSILLAALVLLPVSCRRNAQTGRPLGDLTKSIMTDRTNPWHPLFEGTVSSPEGSIAIIGGEREVLDLAQCFTASDTRDNASAAPGPDMLPDFAGETFCCIIDPANAPFNEAPQDSLCNILIRHVISAIDTIVHVSPYDIEGILRKEPAKMIIVADPCLAHQGIADADSLLSHFKCRIPIVSPMDVMFERVLSAEGAEGLRTVGILCSRRHSDSGIYSSRFMQACRRLGRSGIDCVVFPDDGGKTPVRSFIDKYMHYNSARPLDALLIDGTEHSLRSLKTELADLVSLMNEESVTYRRYISDGFMLLESRTSVIEKCYDMIREHNMFSHHIQAPAANSYYDMPSSLMENGAYILIPETYVQD